MRYRIVPERSTVWVDTRTSVHPIHGRSSDVTGFIDAEVIDGRLDLTTPPKARIEVPVESLTSGNVLYDNELRRRVNARRYPDIVGEVRDVVAGPQQNRYRIAGDLTFHATTRSVEGEISLRSDGSTIEIEGAQTFNVEDFGIKPPRILMLRVYPDVSVRIRLVAELEP